MNTYTIVSTADSSNTLYSEEFGQHYHSTDDGAFNESMAKYILPTFDIFDNLSSQKKFAILDICFGLGYNTFATILYMQKNNIHIPIIIYSPEFDTNLLNSLEKFDYPKEFEEIRNFKTIITSISSNYYYKGDNIEIIIYNGDARRYIKELFSNQIVVDVIYQDAFSSDVNPLLWTKEYFYDISKISYNKTIICTYSIATPIRVSIYYAGFQIYHTKYQIYPKALNKFKHITIASREEIAKFKDDKIDMKKKIRNSTNPNPLSDINFQIS